MSFRSKDETFEVNFRSKIEIAEVNFRSDFKNLYQKLYFLFFYSETKTLRNYNPPLSPITITSCQTCTNQKFMTLFFIIIKIQCWASAYIKITTTDTKYSVYHFIATTYVSDPFFLVQSQTNIDICIHLSFFSWLQWHSNAKPSNQSKCKRIHLWGEKGL